MELEIALCGGVDGVSWNRFAKPLGCGVGAEQGGGVVFACGVAVELEEDVVADARGEIEPAL